MAVKSAEFSPVLVDVSANIMATCGVKPALVLAISSKIAQEISGSTVGIRKQGRNTCLSSKGLAVPISAKSSETAKSRDVPFFLFRAVVRVVGEKRTQATETC